MPVAHSLLSVKAGLRPGKVLWKAFYDVVVLGDRFSGKRKVGEIPEWLERERVACPGVFQQAVVIARIAGRGDIVNSIHNLATENKIPKKKDYYNEVMRGYACSRMLKEASDCMDEIHQSSVKPTRHMYTYLITTLRNIEDNDKNTRWLASMKILNEAVSNGLADDVDIFQAVLRNASSWDQCSVLLKLQRRLRVRHSVKSFNILVDISSRGENNETEQRTLLTKMDELKILRSQGTYTALMNASKNKGDFPRCMKLFHEMLGRGMEPGGFAHAAIVSACCASHDHPLALPTARKIMQRAILRSATSPELWRGMYDLHAAQKDPGSAKESMATMRQIKDPLRADVLLAYNNATGEDFTHHKKGILGNSRNAKILL